MNSIYIKDKGGMIKNLKPGFVDYSVHAWSIKEMKITQMYYFHQSRESIFFLQLISYNELYFSIDHTPKKIS